LKSENDNAKTTAEQLMKALFTSESNKSEVYEVLKSLMIADENLDMKTRIKKPLSFAGLNIYKEWLIDLTMKKTGSTLNRFETKLMRLLVSLDGLSREEIIKGLTTLSQAEQTMQFNNAIQQPMRN
jgi:hypothetical protein